MLTSSSRHLLATRAAVHPLPHPCDSQSGSKVPRMDLDRFAIKPYAPGQRGRWLLWLRASLCQVSPSSHSFPQHRFNCITQSAPTANSHLSTSMMRNMRPRCGQFLVGQQTLLPASVCVLPARPLPNQWAHGLFSASMLVVVVVFVPIFPQVKQHISFALSHF